MSKSGGRTSCPTADDGGVALIRNLMADNHELSRGLLESVNHHLRTPLAVVLGHAELLVHQEHELPADVHESLASVLRAARQLNRVVLGVCDLVAMACADSKAAQSVDITGLVAEWSRCIETPRDGEPGS